MTRPKKRGRKRLQPKPDSPIEVSRSASLWNKIIKSGWAKFGALIAVLATIQAQFGTFDFFRNLFLKPALSIHLSGSDPNPFALPFKIKNEGRFEATDLEPLCFVEQMQDERNNTFHDLNLRVRLDYIAIEAGDEKTAVCGIRVRGEKILSAKIRFQIKYKTLWWFSGTSKRLFMWYPDASPPRWVESD